ncbi:MAG TPA: hypothetical protein VID70_06555 [Solirubrobacteraceae bacterium]|jgi:hypothetical protein
MPVTNTHIRKPLLPASATVALLACVGLAACGGSSSTSTSASATNASANSSASATKTYTTPNRSPGRFAALRECLQKNGVTLPAPTPGQSPLGLGGAAGARQLPKGVTRAQLQAAMKKCGGPGRAFDPGGQAAKRRFGNPTFRKALTAFAACMRSNGVKLPTPDTSGTGPVFSTKGLNTASPAFKAASAKCQSVLRSAFPRPPRPAGAAPGGAQ